MALVMHRSALRIPIYTENQQPAVPPITILSNRLERFRYIHIYTAISRLLSKYCLIPVLASRSFSRVIFGRRTAWWLDSFWLFGCRYVMSSRCRAVITDYLLAIHPVLFCSVLFCPSTHRLSHPRVEYEGLIPATDGVIWNGECGEKDIQCKYPTIFGLNIHVVFP